MKIDLLQHFGFQEPTPERVAGFGRWSVVAQRSARDGPFVAGIRADEIG